MKIKDLCSSKGKLTKKEIEFLRAVTDYCYELYLKNHSLDFDYISGLSMIFEKAGYDFFKDYKIDFKKLFILDIPQIEYLCSLERKLTKNEIIFLREITDAILYKYLKNNLERNHIFELKMIYKKLGKNFFKNYPEDFISSAKCKRNNKKKTKRRKNSSKNLTYLKEDKYAYLVYRTVPNKTGIKIYHY